jgi:hypothetical protein
MLVASWVSRPWRTWLDEGLEKSAGIQIGARRGVKNDL